MVGVVGEVWDVMTVCVAIRSPYGWSIGGEYERSEYKYPVVLHQHVSSFINIEDMLFEVGMDLLWLLSLTFIIIYDPQVFQSEETNTIDKIALGQFVVALENTGLRRQ